MAASQAGVATRTDAYQATRNVAIARKNAASPVTNANRRRRSAGPLVAAMTALKTPNPTKRNTGREVTSIRRLPTALMGQSVA